jgi:GNAT superfamily N-acetyltransferase
VSIEVRRAAADEIRELRLRVLRPDAARVPAGYDLDAATVHIGAFDDGVAVGCGTVFPEPYEDEPLAWRLRGMAVEPTLQGRGVGRLVLEAATKVAIDAGAPLLWANGRVSALEFYRRLGWEAVGEEFDYGPATLAHRVIVRTLISSPGGRTVSRGVFPR